MSEKQKIYELLIFGLKLDESLTKVEPAVRKNARILIIKDVYTQKIISQHYKVGPINHDDIKYSITNVIEDKKKMCEELDIRVEEVDWPTSTLPDCIYADWTTKDEETTKNNGRDTVHENRVAVANSLRSNICTNICNNIRITLK